LPYLIDGNNLLGSWGGLGDRGSDRRLEVVRRVAAFCRARSARATIVFDGAPFRGDRDQQSLGRVSIRFPPRGVDADTVIRQTVDRSARPSDLIVVSSDKALYSYARTRGAAVLRAHEWNAQERRSLRTGSDPADEKPDREDDVEGWLRRFGADSEE